MPVHKFYSNSEKVCRALPANLLAKQITFGVNTDDLVYSVGKVLGMSYSVEDGDVFTYAESFETFKTGLKSQKVNGQKRTSPGFQPQFLTHSV